MPKSSNASKKRGNSSHHYPTELTPNEVVYVFSMNDGEMTLFSEALAYLPQRAVTDNTKAAGIRIKRQFKEAKIILEAHDALLFSVQKRVSRRFHTPS